MQRTPHGNKKIYPKTKGVRIMLKGSDITTVGELRKALSGLKGKTPLSITGLYASETDSIYRAEVVEKEDIVEKMGVVKTWKYKVLVLKTDLCTG